MLEEPVARAPSPAPGPGAGSWRGDVLAAAGLALLTLVPYAQVRSFGFVNLDDQQYVYENALVRGGLSWAGAARALTELRAANWHPLTWLSHMLDVQLFGLDAGWHHVVNVLLHVANAVLLFGFLRAATGARWRSAAVAAVFAIHPLHVESVAWISERKDVLSTLFLFLAFHAWLRHARRPRAATLAAATALVTLGLLCKPMLVTAPVLLLLLDAWPLGRMRGQGEPGRAATLRCLLEKVPMLAIAAAVSVATWMAQSAGDAIVPAERIPLAARLANALTASAAYLEKAVWPTRLAAFYPHPALTGEGFPVWRVAGSAALILGLAALAWRERRRRPYIAWGLAWYAVGLSPVIGILQVGAQAMADRYTYVPLVGPFVAVTWTVADLAGSSAVRRRAAAAVAGVTVLALTAVASRQVATWRDSITLHRHALAVTEGNWTAWLGLGDALSESGHPAEALQAYGRSLAIRPGQAQALAGVGVAHGRMGAPLLALQPLQEAVRIAPRYGEGWYNLGNVYGNLGRHADAAACFREAVRIRPEDARAWANLAVASALAGDPAGARAALGGLGALDPEGAAELAVRLAAGRR